MVKASSVKRLPSGRLKYNGETFPGFNKVQRTPGDTKKFKVLAKKGPDVRKVTFGDSNMTIKKSNPKNKASYCARSGGISGKDDKFSANYWSRKMWDC
jgi:hypothetical protein|tara:strand:+ start:500 stop:793 length:294 start_codon:yes stop_codon:yes gene_type:complete